MTPEILQLREQLVSARKDVVTFSTLADPLQADLEAQIKALKEAHRTANAEVFNELESATQRLLDTEENIRLAMVETYKRYGEKQLAPGLSVRVNVKLRYGVPDAVKWAEVNAPFMIEKTVNRQIFESLPSTPTLDFVAVEEAVTAVISKNLEGK